MPSVLSDHGPNGYDLTLASTSGWEDPGTYVLPNGDLIQQSNSVVTNPGYYIDGAAGNFSPEWGVKDFAIELVVVAGGQSGVTMCGVVSGAGTNWIWDISFPSSNSIICNVYLTTGSTYTVGGSSFSLSGLNHYVFNIESSHGLSTCPTQVVKNNVVVGSTPFPGGGTPRSPGVDHRFNIYNPRTSGAGGAAPRGKISLYDRKLTLAEINDRYLALTVT